MSTNRGIIELVLRPIFAGDKNFNVLLDPIDFTPIVFYELSKGYDFHGKNCVYFHITDSALYLVNGSDLSLSRMGNNSRKSVLDQKYLAKYNFEGWCTSYGERIRNQEIASEIQHHIRMVMEEIKNIYKKYFALNTYEYNTIRHEFNRHELNRNKVNTDPLDNYQSSPKRSRAEIDLDDIDDYIDGYSRMKMARFRDS